MEEYENMKQTKTAGSLWQNGTNPLFPAWEYVPDGEPHIFGNRVYVFGSHDLAEGTVFCQAGNYVVWSAPVEDPTAWTYGGIIYRAEQDPAYWPGCMNALYAPDVVEGNDGRFYLYYNLISSADTNPLSGGIHVAVSDRPDGSYEYYGFVRNPDGSLHHTYLMGDPALLNDDGVIRLYCGWSLPVALPKTGGMPAFFGRTKEELEALEYPLMGANTMVLGDDMLTVTEAPKRIVPGASDAAGTCFEGHAFYEASSIRKINNIYYYIYSSQNSHELCYSTSRYPDQGFIYRGILISNGDIGQGGRLPDDRTQMTSGNHGSLVKLGDDWYIFYHRATRKTTYSRQACADRITLREDGSFIQAACTSMGTGGLLAIPGEYDAGSCCGLRGSVMPGCEQADQAGNLPYLFADDQHTMVYDISKGDRIVYKDFDFSGPCRLSLSYMTEGEGEFEVYSCGTIIGKIVITASTADWTSAEGSITAFVPGDLILVYRGLGQVRLRTIHLA